jgi:SAM-dependent methyltransferase
VASVTNSKLNGHKIFEYIYIKSWSQNASNILDIGCGTGVLEHELPDYTTSRTFALDIDPIYLKFARDYAPQSDYTHCDALSSPFADHFFDVTFCHFLLLWVKNAKQTIAEMVRVTRLNGFVLALAEPDYGGRIDFPSELSLIGAWQTESLKIQGANPYMGRELRSIFHEVGLVDVEVGVMGGQWEDEFSDREIGLEWDIVRSDLQPNHEFNHEVDRLQTLDHVSRQKGQRILYVPTFYAIGMVSG